MSPGGVRGQRRESEPARGGTTVAARRPVAMPPLAPRRTTPPAAAQVTRAVRGQSQTLLGDGQVLVVGGESVAGVSGAAGIRDERTKRVTMLGATLRHARAWHTATVLADGRVWIFGGVDRRGIVAEAEMFDPATQEFGEAGVAMPAARAEHTTTVLTDGRVLVAGGKDGAGKVLDTLEVWDSRTGEVELVGARMEVGRRSGWHGAWRV